MTTKKVALTCIIPIILTIVIGTYLKTAGAKAHGTVGLNVETYGATLMTPPTESDVLRNRAAASKDFGAPRRGHSAVAAVTPTGASPNLLAA